jgi:hypothetical protein
MSTKYATRIHPIFETVEYGYGLLLRKVKRNSNWSFRLCPGFIILLSKTKMNLIVLENTAYTPNNIKKHIQNSYRINDS